MDAMEYPTRLSLYYSPKMEPGGFAYTTVERIEIHQIVVVVGFFSVHCGTVVVAFCLACPCIVSLPFGSNHTVCEVLSLNHGNILCN